MNGTDAQDNQAVALYRDFENLHASLSEEKNGEGSYAKTDGRFKVGARQGAFAHHGKQPLAA